MGSTGGPDAGSCCPRDSPLTSDTIGVSMVSMEPTKTCTRLEHASADYVDGIEHADRCNGRDCSPVALFAIGETYTTRSSCNYECVYSWTVVARTAKFITVTGSLVDGTKRVGVRMIDGSEWAMPLGSYSMAPCIQATRVAVSA